jgi:uncharacterized protein (DUF1330 family)
MSSDNVDHFNVELVTSLPDKEPVVMVNLVKFRERSLDGDGTGWNAYQRYSGAVIKLIKACGGTILWAGDVEGVSLGIPDAHRWDYLVLVQYPSRADFVAMVTSAPYAEANRHRLNGAEDHVILATTQTYGKLKS